MKNPSRGKMPPPEHRCTFRVRLYGVMPRGSRRHWEVDLNTDMEKLGHELLNALIDHGLPWFEFRSDLRNVLNRVRYLRRCGAKSYSSPELLTGWSEPAFLVMLGREAQAKKELMKSLSGGPHDAAVLAVAERLGIDLTEAKSEWARR